MAPSLDNEIIHFTATEQVTEPKLQILSDKCAELHSLCLPAWKQSGVLCLDSQQKFALSYHYILQSFMKSVLF